MVEQKIWLALKAGVESLPTTRDIAWPAEPFDLPAEVGRLQPYIRVAFVSASPDRLGIDYAGPHERTGFLMLTVVYPIMENVTFERYLQEPAEIAAHFASGSTMRHENICVTVPEYPHVMDGYEDGGYFTVPVRIPWRCFA